MKKYLLICFVLFPFFLVAQTKVIISELLYQPPYPNEGQHPHMHNGEFISIYNYENTAVDISGWSLISRNNNTAAQTFVFPSGSIIQSGARFYVAYRGSQTNNFTLSELYEGFLSGTNDREFYQRAIVLNNTGEYLILCRPDGIAQDSIYHSSYPLNATNRTVGTQGYDCVSLQRINVTIEDGIILFKHSDWITRKVALQRCAGSDL